MSKCCGGALHPASGPFRPALALEIPLDSRVRNRRGYVSGSSGSAGSGARTNTASGDTIRGMTTSQPWPMPPHARARTWPVTVLAILAVALAATAVVIALTRSGGASGGNYTAAQRASAKANLCNKYRIAGDAVRTETYVPDNTALSRISETNGAVMLQMAAADPALESQYRDSAISLAAALVNETALGSSGKDDPRFQSAVEETNTQADRLKSLCGD